MRRLYGLPRAVNNGKLLFSLIKGSKQLLIFVEVQINGSLRVMNATLHRAGMRTCKQCFSEFNKSSRSTYGRAVGTGVCRLPLLSAIPEVPFGHGSDREGYGFLANLLSVRCNLLDGAANRQPRRVLALPFCFPNANDSVIILPLSRKQSDPRAVLTLSPRTARD